MLILDNYLTSFVFRRLPFIYSAKQTIIMKEATSIALFFLFGCLICNFFLLLQVYKKKQLQIKNVDHTHTYIYIYICVCVEMSWYTFEHVLSI